MNKFFIIFSAVIFLFFVADSVHAFIYTKSHPGYIFCSPCHEKFTDKKLLILDPNGPFTCGEAWCHNERDEDSVESRPEYWARIHNRRSICKNCHPQKNGTYQIHDIHVRDTVIGVNVQCKICHQRPEGYNSTIVSIPPSEGVTKPQWNGSCFYCHKTREGGNRLHDFHQPVLLKEGTCEKCHTDRLKPNPKLIERIAGEIPDWALGNSKNVEGIGDIEDVGDVETFVTASAFYEETLKFFDEIAVAVNTMFDTFKREVIASG